MSTFVSVGNATQPFPRLLHAVAKISATLPQPVFVQFGCALESNRSGLAGAAYVDMTEFERRIDEAQLVIMHAGAGSVISALRAGKVPAVMPRRGSLGEIVDDHQLEFAAQLERAGRLFVANDADSLELAVHKALKRQRERVRAQHSESTMVPLVRRALLKGQDKSPSP